MDSEKEEVELIGPGVGVQKCETLFEEEGKNNYVEEDKHFYDRDSELVEFS